MTAEDQLHARAIEHLMCTFTLDLEELSNVYCTTAYALLPYLQEMATRLAPFAELEGQRIDISPDGRCLTRIIASVLDQHVPEGLRHSRTS